MPDKQSVCYDDFIRAFMRHGLTYVQATSAYEAMCATVESGITQGHRVNIGRIGRLEPTVHSPRVVKMGFSRVKNKVEHVRRTYYIDRRVTYRFKMFHKFLETRRLKWENL